MNVMRYGLLILTVETFSIFLMMGYLLSSCCLIANINNYKVNCNSLNIQNIQPFSHIKSFVRARASKCLYHSYKCGSRTASGSLPSRFNATVVSPTADASKSRSSEGSWADRPRRRCPRVSRISFWPWRTRTTPGRFFPPCPRSQRGCHGWESLVSSWSFSSGGVGFALLILSLTLSRSIFLYLVLSLSLSFSISFILYLLSLIHIWRCRRSTLCRSRWSPYH